MRRVVLLLSALAVALTFCLAQQVPVVPVPSIYSISPSSAVAGGPGFNMTVTGSNLASYTTVRWNGIGLSCTVNYLPAGAASLTCAIPTSYIVSPGSASVQAVNSIPGYGSASSNTVTFTIQPSLTITTACPMANGNVGTYYSQALSATGGVTPYMWSISSGSLPPGLSITTPPGTVGGPTVIAGTPTSGGTYNFTLRVTDYTQQSATRSCSITIGGGLTITTACPLPAGSVGTPYSQPFTATGGMTPYNWSIVDSSPPPGLSLTSYSGVLSGTPTTAGNFNFIVRVADYTQQSATKACSIAIVSALSITSISPPSAVASCGGAVLTITGTGFLPPTIAAGSMVEFTSPGMGVQTLQASYVTSTQMQVSVPESLLIYAGTASVRVVNPGGVYSNAVNFTISPGPTITSIRPTWATAGSAEFTLIVRGSAFVAPGATSGSLVQFVTPGGGGSALETTFVTDSELRAQVSASLLTVTGVAQVAVISPPCSLRSNLLPFEILDRLQIVNTSLPDGVVGAPYTATLQATGGKPPYVFSVTGDLASLGLRYTAATGVISGTPTAAGSLRLVIGVSDSVGNSASRELSITVLSGLSITTASPLPTATAGVSYAQPLAATGGTPPYSWSAVGLPPWLSLNSSTGALTGTPTAAGTIDFTVRVTDSAQASATKSFSLTVLAGLTIVTASPLPAATVGSAYGHVLSATGGTPPYAWSATGLPGWLSLNASTGALTGIPAAPATHEFTVRVTDRVGSAATKVFTLSVSAVVGALSITTGSPLPAGMTAVAYSQTLAAIGGSPPYRWSITAGSLPQGLSLNATTGAVSGTPTAAGTASFTAQVTDNAQRTATKAFSLTINPVPAAQYSGLTATVQPAQQPRLQLNLAAAVAAPITGVLTLTFAADAVNPIDNPEVVFADGSRRVNFTIPAGQTRAQFGTAQEMGIQVGTVAGAITVAAAPLTGTVVARVERRAPAISSVRVTRTSSGFDVEIIGYATPRSVTSAAFTFTATGADLQTPTLTVNVDSTFTTWYRNSASNAFGSQFRYVQPFTVSGSGSAVNSVSVTLTNANGTSSAVSANF